MPSSRASEGPLDALRRNVRSRYRPDAAFRPLPHDPAEEWASWIEWGEAAAA